MGMVGCIMGAGGKVMGGACVGAAGAAVGGGAGVGAVGVHATLACCARAFFHPAWRPHWSGRTMVAPFGLPPMVLNFVAATW